MKLLPWLFGLVVLFTTALHAQNISTQTRNLLRNNKFEELDKLYSELREGPFDIHVRYPDLNLYFSALVPKSEDKESVWTAREKVLKKWGAEHPDSIAAILALGEFYNSYAGKARGTSYNKNVPEEGRRLFVARKEQVHELLAVNSERLKDELWFYYLAAQVLAQFSNHFEEYLGIVDVINDRWPDFVPAYTTTAYYLLPRWHGEKRTTSEYAALVLENLGSPKGEVVYALIMGMTAQYERKKLFSTQLPDMKVVIKGYEEILKKADYVSSRYEIYRYAYLLGLAGEWDQLRSVFLRIGPVYDFSVWGRRSVYNTHIQRSGAWQQLQNAWNLEKEGKLDEAKQLYISFNPDLSRNPWLTGFYIRHRQLDQYLEQNGAYDLKAPVAAEKAMNSVSLLCILYPSFGDYTKARQAAERFDKARGHNLLGKLAFYQSAVYEGNREEAEKARLSIVELKTDRPSYQMAQEFLKNPDKINPYRLNWDDSYATQAATAMALYLFEMGKHDEARALLEKAYHSSVLNHERHRVANMYFYPPQNLK